MIRSSEFKRSRGTESPKQELAHMRVHPATPGGKVKVEHIMRGKHGVAATHEFDKKSDFMEHMDVHSGLEGKAGGVEADSGKATGYPEAE